MEVASGAATTGVQRFLLPAAIVSSGLTDVFVRLTAEGLVLVDSAIFTITEKATLSLLAVSQRILYKGASYIFTWHATGAPTQVMSDCDRWQRFV